MGASLWLRHRGFKATKNPRELGFKSAPKKATISATIAHDFRHNRALIGVDRAPYTPRNAIRSRRNESATNTLGSRFDRAAIAARSRLDRTAIIGFFLDLSAPSDGALIVIKNPTLQRVPRGFTEAVRSRSRDLPLMTIQRSSRRHVASGKPFDHFT